MKRVFLLCVLVMNPFYLQASVMGQIKVNPKISAILQQAMINHLDQVGFAVLFAAHLPLVIHLTQQFAKPCDKASREYLAIEFHVFHLTRLSGLPAVLVHAFIRNGIR